MTKRIILASYGTLIWMSTIICLLVILLSSLKWDSPFFRVGPHKDLAIFGMAVDNGGKYFVVISYTVMSTVMRTIQMEIMSPWIIQNIQNDDPKNAFVMKHAYTIISIDTCYRWFDWFMYMNLLLSQVDIMVVEVVGNLIVSIFTTYHYLNKNEGESAMSNKQLSNFQEEHKSLVVADT